MQELELTAYHEAGHWIAGYVLNEDAGDVSVIPDPDEGSLGRVLHLKGPLWRECVGEPRVSEFIPETIEKEIVILYAGYYAQVRCNPSGRADALRGAGKDRMMISELLVHLAASPAARKQARVRLRRRSKRLIEKHWHVIERLALELMEHKRLDSYHAELLAAEARAEAEGDSETVTWARAYRQYHLSSVTRIEEAED